MLRRLGVGPDRVRVAEGAQVVDALVLGALDPEDVDDRPGAEQRLAEGDLLPALQLRGARRGVERHHVAAAEQLDVVLLVPGGRVDVGVLARAPRRAGTPWRAAAVRRAARARGRRAGPSPRRRACAARPRSGRRPCRRRSGGSRPRDRPRSPSTRSGSANAAAAAVAAGGPKIALSSSSLPGSSTASTSSPGSSTVSAPGHEALAVAQDRDQQAALRHRQVPDPAAGDRAVLAEQHLDDLELLLLQVEQVDEAVLGHLVLEQAQDQVGRRDRRA